MSSNTVDFLKYRLDQVLGKDGFSWESFKEKNADSLLHELSVYHQELEYQNDELRRIQTELEISRQYYKDLFESAPINYILYDEDYIVAGANNFCSDTLRVQPDLLIGKDLTSYIHPDSQDIFYLHLRSIQQKEGDKTCILSMVREDDSLLQAKLQSNLIEYRGKRMVRTAFLDISKEYAQQMKIEALTFRDSLTGLYNRLYLDQMMESVISAGNLPLGVIMGDVNALKLTNDTFGHATGDALLVAASKIFTGNVPKKSLLVRMGGDEFLCLIPHANERQLERLINILEIQCSEITIGAIQLSVSFGFDVHKTTKESFSQTFMNAESLMYQNKLYKGKQVRESIVQGIADSLFASYPSEKAHAIQVRAVCMHFLPVFELSMREGQELLNAAFLHDLGKVALEADLILRGETLAEDQIALYHRHPEKGFRILSSLEDQHAVAEAILYHHERWDGKGYPMAIVGEEIPLFARIIAIADSVVWYRNKHPNQSIEDLRAYLRTEAGSILDPQLVEKLITSKLVSDTNLSLP